MSVEILYFLIGVSMLLGAILVGLCLANKFRKTPTIDLIQGRLTDVKECPLNPDYLKITNEWEEDS